MSSFRPSDPIDSETVSDLSTGSSPAIGSDGEPASTTVVGSALPATHLPTIADAHNVGLKQWPTLRRFLVRFLRNSAYAAFAMLALLGAIIVAYRWIDPPASNLMIAQHLTGTTIRQTWKPLDEISPNLLRAVVMSEDAGFCRHRGVDWRELEDAYARSVAGGFAGGASTITMQVVKNLFLWPERSIFRKAIEIPLSLAVDWVWPKRRTMEIYLNIVELGPGIFGVEAAAQHYFRKPARALRNDEAALLATALPNPLQRNSSRPSRTHRTLANRIEARMRHATRHITCLNA